MNPPTIVTPDPSTEPKKENFFFEIVKFILVALAIVIPVRAYVAQPFIVNGESMNPTFTTGQYLIVDQLSYHLGDPKRNDVVVFRYPNNPKTYYIKRIIGLPGETISIKQGKVTIIDSEHPQGFELGDEYVIDAHKTTETFETKLGSTQYFVLGDNRAQSSDSRAWGNLDSKYIIGKPFIRLFPFSKIAIFPGQAK